MNRTFYSLRFYNYRVWFFTALIANTGTWMQRVAQDWLVLAILTDDDGFAVGVVTALQFLPLLFFTPLAGVLADRYDKRKIMYFTQGGMGLLAVGLGALVLTGVATVEHVYIFAFALGTISAIDAPPRQVFVSELVPKKNLPNAVGLNSASFNGARLIGPGVAGLLIAIVGPGWVFIINGVSFLATIGGLVIMRPEEFHPSERQADPSKHQIREALAYVKHRTDIVVVMTVAGVVSCLGLNFQLTSATMAREVFDKNAGEYGVLGSIMAIGSLAGALMAARRSSSRVRLVVIAAFAFGIVAGINALMPTYEWYAVSVIATGFATLTMLTAANTAIQTSVDPAIRGRVMALYQVVLMGSTPIGAPIVGWISQNIHPRWGIGVGSISALLVSFGAYLWVRKHWNVTVEYRRKSKPHLVIIGPAEQASIEHRQAARLMEEGAQEQAALIEGRVAVPPRSMTPPEPEDLPAESAGRSRCEADCA